MNKELNVSIAIPCLNEEKTIGGVVESFRRELPEARIFVFDNNSKDKTVELAEKSGAIVISEKRRGKGNVIQSIFSYIDTEILIIVDGDNTYFAEDVHKLIDLVVNYGVDMAVGDRLSLKKGMSLSHHVGNVFFKTILNWFFGAKFNDILSGYRAFSRDFYKNVPILSEGFEIETELTLQSLERGFRVQEVPIKYQNRPSGSHSKINEISDSYRIIFTIISLLRDYRPITFFSWLGSILLLTGLFLGIPIIAEYVETGFVPRFPTAILAASLMILSFNSFIAGLIVSAINRRNKELEKIIYGNKK